MSARGFSLIEVVVSASILAVVSLAVAGVLINQLAAERSLVGHESASDAVANEAVRLQRLTYWRVAANEPLNGERVRPPSLLGDVFPSTEGAAPGAKLLRRDGVLVSVTQTVSDEIAVTREASFTRPGALAREWALLPLVATPAWSIWRDDEPPSDAIVVRLSARRGQSMSEIEVHCSAASQLTSPSSPPAR